MKKKNVLGIVLSLCSAAFYVLAIIGFSSAGDTATSAIWLCLGSSLLCISTVLHRRTSEDEKKEAAEAEFQQEKTKLDRALAMELLSQDEYDVKLASARKKVDNFEAIRKVEQQFEMDLMSREERDAKIAALMG